MSEEAIKNRKEQKINRLANGQFQKGTVANPNGRPVVPEIAELRAALKKIAEQTGVPFFELFVRMAYKHKEVAIALAKKLIPDKLQGEGFGNSGVYVYIVKNGKIAGRGDSNRIALHSAPEPANDQG